MALLFRDRVVTDFTGVQRNFEQLEQIFPLSSSLISAGVVGDISTIDPDDAAAAGTAERFARADHQHAITAAVAGTISPDDTAAEGVASSFARSDHRHAITAAAAGTIAPDDTAAEGSASSFARSDHRHAITAAAASTLTGQNQEGSASSFARSDHNHAFPNYGRAHGSYIAAAPADTAVGVANRMLYASIPVYHEIMLTGIRYRVGSVKAGNVRVALYNSAGTRVADCTATIACGNAATTQDVPFDATYTAPPGRYFGAIIFDTSTSTYQGAFLLVACDRQTEASFATPSSITAPTAPINQVIPLLSTY